MTDDIPELKRVAAQASIDDYSFDKPTMEGAFQGLTLGETHRYYSKACQTMGAIYETHVSKSAMSISVTLPDSLSLNGCTEKEAKGHEAYLHNEMEKCITWIIRWHKIHHGEDVI